MITSIHTLIYSDDAQATRAFLRDVLRWPNLAMPHDADWLIFNTGPSELGVHPTATVWQGEKHSAPKHHAISLMCDNIEATVAELTERGATFEGEIRNMGFGKGIQMEVPGADSMLLYEPLHPIAYNLE